MRSRHRPQRGGLWGPEGTSDSPALLSASSCSEMTAHTSALVTRRCRPRTRLVAPDCPMNETVVAAWRRGARPPTRPVTGQLWARAGRGRGWAWSAQLQACVHSQGWPWRRLRGVPQTRGCLAAEPQCPRVPPTTVPAPWSGSTEAPLKEDPEEGPASSERRPCWRLRPLPQSTFRFSTSFRSNQRVTMATELGCVHS